MSIIEMIEKFIIDHNFDFNFGYSFLALVVLLAFLALCLLRNSWRRWIFRHLKCIAVCVFIVGILV